MVFSLPLPDRGHAAAAHPLRPDAIAFARRPGTFALVIDCARGQTTAELIAPNDRHFYGHGVFSEDGSRLYTTENDLETLEGRIGVWETEGYTRLGDFSSGGIGPHDIRRMPGRDMLIVANGGIETHPDSGRAKLNLPTMRSNLSFVSPDGVVANSYELPPEMRLNSIRHLAVRSDGMVAAAMQWQGDPLDVPALLLLYESDATRFLEANIPTHQSFHGYAGSVAFSGGEDQVAITSPSGGILAAFSIETGECDFSIESPDVCGLASSASGFAYTNGQGLIAQTAGFPGRAEHAQYSFDNHLVPV